MLFGENFRRVEIVANIKRRGGRRFSHEFRGIQCAVMSLRSVMSKLMSCLAMNRPQIQSDTGTKQPWSWTNNTDTVADLFTSSSSLLKIDCRSNQIEPIAQRSPTLLNYLSHSSAMAKSNESAILTTLMRRLW